MHVMSFGTVDGAWRVEVAHGPDAGRRWVLSAGRSLTIGRAEVADPTISGRHLAVGEQWQDTLHGPVPLVRNLSATNPATIARGASGAGGRRTHPEPLPQQGFWGTGKPQTISIGASAIVLARCPGDTDTGGTDSTARRSAAHRQRVVRIDRPPLRAVRPSLSAIEVPVAATARQAPRLSIAGLVLPVVTGAVLAILINPMLAVMAAMSPVLMLGSWIEERRRVRNDRAKGLRSTAEQLERFETALLDDISTCTDDLLTRHPGTAELCRIADQADHRLWERRPDHVDAGLVTVGLGTRPAPRRLNRVPGLTSHIVADAVADRLRDIDQVPVTISLGAGRIIGVIGDRPHRVGLSRSLLIQAAVMHGPADLRIAFLADPSTGPDWAWATALPHVSAGCDPLLSCHADTVRSVLEDLERTPMWTVLVVDGAAVLDHVQVRSLVAATPEWLALVVLADRIDQIPQRASATVHVQGVLASLVQNPPTDAHVQGTSVVISGIGVARARRVAGALATCQDGASLDDGSALVPSVHLGDLLKSSNRTFNPGSQDAWDAHIRSHWDAGNHQQMNRLRATLGLAGADPVVIDLVADGPHALIAGTTGSGKSELLRTLVCSLAADHSPQQLTFVLIDYKGGAAFTGLDALPHTVGFVTDLDAGLGSRALTCLDAELRHRELMLNAAGAEDITAYPHGRAGAPPLPRLVVVIDEFATMLAELPDFISALIGIAQRGRSLGVHLILATQRPAGAVNDSIRANTNLRLCLRVQTTADSADVIGSPRAAILDRRFPGRAVLRTGPEEFVTMQTASCTLRRATDATALVAGRTALQTNLQTGLRTSSHGELTGFRRLPGSGVPGSGVPGPGASSMTEPALPTELDQIVEAAQRVASSLQLEPPRRPWPEPLPGRLPLFAPDSGALQLGLIDRPELQRTDELELDIFRRNTVLFGAAGSGVSASLAAVAAAFTQRDDPDTLHLYLVDHGAGVFTGLESMPHVGARVTATEPERLDRLARVLAATIDTRRADRETRPDVKHPHVVVCIDDWGALRAATDDVLGNAQERWFRIFSDGPSVGVTAVISADRAQALPGSALASFGTRFAFRLNDPLDDAMLGISRSAPQRGAVGRALDLGSGAAVQFSMCDDLSALTSTATTGASTKTMPSSSSARPAPHHDLPKAIELLPSIVRAQTIWEQSADHPTAALRTGRAASLSLPVGIGDSDLALVGWKLQQGEHLLITGPGRSGKSNALALLAVAARSERPKIRIVTLTSGCNGLLNLGCNSDHSVHHSASSDRSPLSATLGALAITHHRAGDIADAISNQVTGSPADGTLILVDDAELADDPTGEMARFIAARTPNVWIAAAGRADSLRSAYGHWTGPLRRSRKGLALRPHVEMDGELWATPLPRNQVRGGGRAMPTGRGYLLDDGHVELVQVGWLEPAIEQPNGFSPIECGNTTRASRRIAS